jgi:hypothetical protein
MTSPFHNGIIHQQDISERNIARQRIAEAIAREAQRTGILVDLAITRINSNPHELYSAAKLWNVIQHDETLFDIQRRVDHNVFDYPCFNDWVSGSRNRLKEKEMNRLRKALLKPQYQHRFAHTVGFRPAFA